jgi:hypothetical protein
MHEQLQDLMPAFITSSVMGIAIYALTLVKLPNDYILLFVQVILGVTLYISLCYFARVRAFVEFIEIVKPRIPIWRGGR